MDAYTNFPKFCCRCLEPDPDGTWPVKNSHRENLGNGQVLVRTVAVQVPMCGQCRRNLRLRDAGAVGGALAVGGLALGWWWLDTPDLNYLPFGVVFAFIVFGVALVAFGWLFKVSPFSNVAYLEPDGSDIKFANPDYQRLYTGESRQGRPNDTDWRQVNWR